MPNLITLTELKQELEITRTDIDTVLSAWIVQVSGAVVDICKQPVVSTTVYEEFDGTGGGTKALRYRPVTVTAVETKTGVGEAWTAITDAYELRTLNKLPTIVSAGVFTRGTIYRATLTVGYAADAIPAPVKRAALLACKEYYNGSVYGTKGDGIQGRDGVKSMSKSGDYGTITTSFVSLLPDVMKILDTYRAAEIR